MKVNAHPPPDTHGAAVRMVAKARSSAPAAGDVAAPVSAPASASAAPAGQAASTSAESTVEMAARKSPPGLLRVAARLEAMGTEGRTGGQSNALAQITRNLQRYIDHQGVAPAPAPALTPAPEPAATAVDSAAAADTPAATNGAEQPASG